MRWRWRAVAAFGHAPGLWLVYRQTLPRETVRWNVVAAGLTILGMVVAGIVASLMATVAVWAIGHVLWGSCSRPASTR